MREMLGRQGMGVLATLGPEEQPHCSLMCYVTDHDGQRLFLLTAADTQKYRNILEHPRVSFLVDNRGQGGPPDQLQALTVEGTCGPLSEPSARQAALERLLGSHPQLKAIADSGPVQVLALEIKSWQLLRGLTQASYQELG